MFRNSLLNRNIAHKNLFPALVIVVLGLLMGNNTALMDHNFSRENVMYNCACYFAGDSSHPDNPDLVGDGDEPEIQQTILESRLSAKRLHRIEFISRHDVHVHCNFDLPYQQISTWPGQKFKESLTKRDENS